MPRNIGPRKYAPLTRYLASLTVDEVRLTFAEVEQIIGAPLPVAARSNPFWSNGALGVLRAQPWTQAGWRVVRRELHTASAAVTFARVASDSAS